MKIASTTGAEALTHDGVEYTADKHGLFDVPHEVGQKLLEFPHWVEEHVRDAEQAAKDEAEALDPHNLAGRVADLEAGLAEAHDLLAELKSKLDELGGGSKPPAKAPAKKAPAKAADKPADSGDSAAK